MDGGISDIISGVLSNPDAFNKIISAMPAVVQMMNGGGSNNLTNLNNINNLNREKIVETIETAETAALNPDIPAENIMSNEKVATALKNLIAALNNASPPSNPPEDKPQNNQNNININQNIQDGDINIPDSGIEKTLDTLKNFSSATNPESDHRSKLLLALKPFLKDARRTKIDTAIKYMNAAKIINLFGKNGFV